MAGLLCFSRLLHYLLHRFHEGTMALLTGPPAEAAAVRVALDVVAGFDDGFVTVVGLAA